jgi:nucleotide-binding universal stress UspA family protein
MPEGLNRPTADDVMQMREKVRVTSLRRLEELTLQSPKLAVTPEFLVEFGSPSEEILKAANTVKADAIILGLHHSTHIGATSHLPWATAYDVVCGAGCSVLTVRN